MTTAAKKSNPIVRFLPILGWLPHYDKTWLTGDLVAGLSVWALMVPQALGYATISGVTSITWENWLRSPPFSWMPLGQWTIVPLRVPPQWEATCLVH